MANPWLKRNPFLSMWLITANRVTGAWRAQAMATGQREVQAVRAEPNAAPAPGTKPRRER